MNKEKIYKMLDLLVLECGSYERELAQEIKRLIKNKTCLTCNSTGYLSKDEKCLNCNG